MAEQIELYQKQTEQKLQEQEELKKILKDYKGKWVALYFYPKDDTPGCTTQACGFRDNVFAFNKEGAPAVEFKEGVALYRDRDVPKALAQGNLEMALPGLWQLDKFVPDAVVLDLPVFYGATAEQIYTITDGGTPLRSSSCAAKASGARSASRV